MKKGVKYTELSDEALMEKWLSTFGKGVDKNIMEEHVTSYGNLLWHLFTWGEVPCLKGEDARKAMKSVCADHIFCTFLTHIVRKIYLYDSNIVLYNISVT